MHWRGNQKDKLELAHHTIETLDVGSPGYRMCVWHVMKGAFSGGGGRVRENIPDKD